MSLVVSPSNTDLILLGHKFKQLSDANDAIMIADRNAKDFKWGADGGFMLGTTGQTGQVLTVKLLPNSETFLQFLLPKMEMERASGVVTEYNGDLIYRSLDISVSLQQGYIVTEPSAITVGNSFPGDITIEWAFKEVKWSVGANTAGSNAPVTT